jgi:hypothetical protein
LFRVTERHKLGSVRSTGHVAEIPSMAIHDRRLATRRDDDGPLLRRNPRGSFMRKKKMGGAGIGNFHNLRRQDRLSDGAGEAESGFGI